GEKDVTTIVFGSKQLPSRFDVRDVGGTVPGVRVAFPRTVVPYQYFPQTVSLGGDTNGDGIGEILLGDPEWDPISGMGKGRVHVVFGGDSLPSTIDLEEVGFSIPGFVVLGVEPITGGTRTEDGIGRCVRTVGDVDGDGFGDLGIAGNSCGKGSYLLF